MYIIDSTVAEFDTNYRRSNNAQLRQPIFEDSPHYSGNNGLKPRETSLEDYLQSRVGPGVGILPLEPNSRIEDSLQRARGLSGDRQPIRNDNLNQGNQDQYSQQNEDQGRQQGDYYSQQTSRNPTSYNSDQEQHKEDLSQQFVYSGRNENLESFQRPRSFTEQGRFQNSNSNEQTQRIQPIEVEESVVIDQNPRRMVSGREQSATGSENINSQTSGANKKLESTRSQVNNQNEQVGQPAENFNDNIENNDLSGEFPEFISAQEAANSPPPRFTSSIQVNQTENITKKPTRVYAVIEPPVRIQNQFNQKNSESQPSPLRGDLPGTSGPVEEKINEELNLPTNTEKEPEMIQWSVTTEREPVMIQIPITTEKEPGIIQLPVTTKKEPEITEKIPTTSAPIPTITNNPFINHGFGRVEFKNNQSISFQNRGVNCPYMCNHNSQSNRYNGGFFYNQHSIHHKFNYTRSNYYIHQNTGANLQQQIPSLGTFNRQNSFTPYTDFSKPIEFNQRFHTQQASNYKIESHQNYDLKPYQLEQQRNSFNIFQQQTHHPIYAQPLRQTRGSNQQLIQPIEFDQQQQQQQQQQIPFNQDYNQHSSRYGGFNQQQQKTVPFDQNYNQQSNRYVGFNQQQPKSSLLNHEYEAKVEEINRSETEKSTTPKTFWKRVGQKLSNSYDKAKEKISDIFG